MATEFICAVGPGQKDYTSMAAWEAACESNITNAQTRVYSISGVVGVVHDAATITGSNNDYVAFVKHVTDTQVMLYHDTVDEVYENNEYVHMDSDNYIVIAANGGNGDTVISVQEFATSDGSPDGYFSNAGWTTSSTNKIIFRPQMGHEATVPYSKVRYRIESTTAMTIFGHVEIYQLQASGLNGTFLTGNAVNDILIDKCNFRGGKGASDKYIIWCQEGQTNSVVKIRNTICAGALGTNGAGIFMYNGETTFYVYNCTIKNCKIGIAHGDSVAQSIKNCIINCANAFDGTFTDDDDYNDYNSSSQNLNDVALGSHGRYNQTFSFIDDINNGDFRLKKDDLGAKDHGIDLSEADLPVIEDFDEKQRPITGPDIGAFEYYDISNSFFLLF